LSTEDHTTQMGDVVAGAGQPTEEELRAAYEAELSRITTTDMMAQAAVSLLNLGARRLAPVEERDPAGVPQRDVEQARDAIDGVRALLEILERRIPQELAPLRDALSRLQMAYAREMQSTPAGQPQSSAPGAEPGSPEPRQGAAPAPEPGPAGGQPGAPGPAEASGRLWVPGR
jgi:hypothetical protein